jgi:hypothetical protein
MWMSVCEKTTTLIFLDLQLVHHFIDGTCIGSSTTAINATTFLVLLLLLLVLVLLILLLLPNCSTVNSVCFKFKLYCDRQSVGQSVLVSCPFWSRWPDVTFLWVTITFFICSCRAPFLTRRRVCNLQCNDASSLSSYIATDGLSASLSWCLAPNGAYDQILISLFDSYILSSWCRAPSPISPMKKVIQPKIKVKNQSHVSVGQHF